MCVCVWLGSSLSFKRIWLNNRDTFCLYNFIKFPDKCLGFKLEMVDEFSKIKYNKEKMNTLRGFINSSTHSNLKPSHLSGNLRGS